MKHGEHTECNSRRNESEAKGKASFVPDFFIVGAPKCGTTSMARYLAEHSDIFVPAGEPHFFGQDINYNPERITRDQYINLYAGNEGRLRLGDHSTWYLFSKTAAAEIYECNPDARIIIQIRNPVDMLYSLHWHYYHKTGREEIANFEEALASEDERRRGCSIPKRARFPQQLFYSEVARYTEQIERYVETFGWQNIEIVLFDDLKARPEHSYRQLLRFLDVGMTSRAKFPIHNPAVVHRNRIVHSILSAPLFGKIAKNALPDTIAGSLRRVRNRLVKMNLRPAKRPPMPADVQKRLNIRFQEEVESLSDLLGRDVTHWLR